MVQWPKLLPVSLGFLTLSIGVISPPAMADLTDKIASKQADQGIIHIRSHHTVSKTSERLVNALQAKGMTLFTRIDHAAGAQSVGQSLPPTELVVFGNPKVGTRLMQCSPTTAIDLPQKALIWRDKAGQVWLSYNDPQYLAKRHHIEGCGEVLAKIEQALSQFAQAATQP